MYKAFTNCYKLSLVLGNVYSYDERGVLVEDMDWDCSLCISMIGDMDRGLCIKWDNELRKSLDSTDFVPHRLVCLY